MIKWLRGFIFGCLLTVSFFEGLYIWAFRKGLNSRVVKSNIPRTIKYHYGYENFYDKKKEEEKWQ